MKLKKDDSGTWTKLKPLRRLANRGFILEMSDESSFREGDRITIGGTYNTEVRIERKYAEYKNCLWNRILRFFGIKVREKGLKIKPIRK